MTNDHTEATSSGATGFSVPAVLDAVTSAIPDRESLVQGQRRYTYSQVLQRSNRLATYLHSQGLGAHTDTPRST